MPVKDKEGRKTAKTEWNEKEYVAFNQDIFDFIAKAEAKKKLANLSGVVFPGAIHFDHFKTPESALPFIWFFGARFIGPVSFDGAYFASEAWFNKACFADGASFSEVHFAGGASFEEADFADEVWFNDAYFAGVVAIDMVQFEGISALFDKAHFASEAWFKGAHFAGGASFSKAHFVDEVWFNDAHFEGAARFDEAHFEDGVSFLGRAKKPAAMQSEASGEESRAIGDSFQAASFAAVQFTNSNATCDFSDRRFLRAADFSGAVFRSVPKFHESRLHQDTSFRETKFHNTRSKDAPAAYRTLKLAMEELRAWDEANMFYALERKSWRQQKDTPRIEKAFAWLYEIGSYYGTKILRPLGWLALVTFAAFVVYDGMLESHAAAPGGGYKPKALEAMIFTIEQLVRPFAVWTADYLKSTGGMPSLALATARTLMENFPFWARAIATVQSVVSLALVALFLLALRRRFKMG